MTVALETFVKQLEDSGVVAPGKLENFIPPKAMPKDAEELARQLVESKHLTAYQAKEIAQGRGKSLILGNYTILDKIGAGGMGQVFKAEHRRMHRIVAIKMLPAAMTSDAAAIARFEREVTAAAKLEHPNIVHANDADEANGVHFLVMQYVEGQDLSALVKKDGPFSVAKAVNYILQAARGLEYAHKHGVIHRDIKPGNLLLGSDGNVKILDMGLARLDSDGEAPTQAELTGTGAVMGTVDYMSPEQALNTKNADNRADIYSLGITLYFLLAGKPAYQGESAMEKLLAHREQAIPLLGENIPEQVQAVFSKMVAKKKEERYQSMTDVVADLEKCQTALLSASANAMTSTWQSSGTVGSELSFAMDNQAVERSTPKLRRPARILLVAAGLLGLALLAGVIFKMRTKDGTLVVEVDQPDALVQVFNKDGKIEITDRSGKNQIAVSVDPGKHKIKVEKDGFVAFSEAFEIEVGGKKAIKALLEPVRPTEVAGQADKPWNTPAFQQWMKDVATQPAQKQVDAVGAKLQELNPGFDGMVRSRIENGIVTGLGFVTEQIVDISPVRALAALQILNCGGVSAEDWGKPMLNYRRGKLSDLSPLQGMKLTLLFCVYTNISDLSPLRGMPLTKLHCTDTKVSDLSPLEGMQLTSIHCSATNVSNLSPLHNMPLTSLSCLGTQVSDLTPLAQCRMLIELNVKSTTVTAAGVAALQQALPNCKIEWDDPAKPKTPEPAATVKLAYLEPAFQQWIKETQTLPVEQQIDAVSKKLMELNPGFDGKVTGYEGKGTQGKPTIENGVVTDFGFITDNLTDISPVQAFRRLSALACCGTESRRGRLFDLSPLKGLVLTKLDCGWSPLIADR